MKLYEDIIHILDTLNFHSRVLDLKPVEIDPENPPRPSFNNSEAQLSESEFSVRSNNTLSRNAAVSYAYKYYQNYNGAYRSFSPRDCTNFISQALFAGGWPMVSGYYQYSTCWYYYWIKPSWTWTGAHNWAAFNCNSRGRIVSDLYSLGLGDILQMDFEKNGSIDHSMIVTKKDASGMIYLTYHSDNTRDNPLITIFKKFPTAKYYGWKLYDSFI